MSVAGRYRWFAGSFFVPMHIAQVYLIFSFIFTAIASIKFRKCV